MNDGGDDGDVDGDECWSNVKCPQFDIFFQRRFAPGLAFRTRGCVFTPRSFCTQVTFTHGNV